MTAQPRRPLPGLVRIRRALHPRGRPPWLETVIRMKSEVGREQDRIDVENLRLRLRDGDTGS